MDNAIERLISLDEKASDYFERADRKWAAFFARSLDDPIETWSSWLTAQEIPFELECGGKRMGHQVMAWSGFAHIFSHRKYEDPTGMGRKLLGAFRASLVSADIAKEAAEAAAFYL